MKKPERSIVSLLTAWSFIVLAGTGILAFVRPCSIQIVGLHSLMGFVFVGLIVLHVVNNLNHLSRYLRSKLMWLTLAITVGLAGLFLWQPSPIRSILSLSQNLGPATDGFQVKDDGLVYHYIPAPQYKMDLPADPDNPMPYRLLIEIDQPEDDQPSRVYSAEIDNADPRAFQLLDLVGYPKREEDDSSGKEVWELYFVDEPFDSALALIDSVLLTIDRN